MTLFASLRRLLYNLSSRFRLLLSGAALVMIAAPGMAQQSDDQVIHEALGIALPVKRAYNIMMNIPVDVLAGPANVHVPKEGDDARFTDGSEAKWQRITADSNGWFSAPPMTERFVAVTIERPAPGRFILEGMGHDIVFVNGTPRSGNTYQQKDKAEAWEPRFDYSRIPIDLRAGQNVLVFRYSRGRMKVVLHPVRKDIAFNDADLTLPDMVTGSALDSWGGIVVVNSTNAPLKGFALVSHPAGAKAVTTEVPEVPPMGVRKVAFRVRASQMSSKGTLPVLLTLLGNRSSKHAVVDTVTIPIRVVGSEDSRKETFISGIDGSVQYYAVLPPRKGMSGPPALFFSLHGAGVEAINQAGSYYPKKWGYVVAPTNRRPYGFSWEDWGRMDALEVLDRVKKEYNFDEGRIYLTGHSMGGHGTWFMGATYPDKFAAIAPSAGWITFQSYRFAGAQEEKSVTQQMLSRSATGSDLFALAENYKHFGIYIVHGQLDDNVPREQSLMMIDRLKPIHNDFVYYEQPGAGHWWDNSPEPGADCVDWRPMFDFFARHIRPGVERIRTLDFTTANPAVSSRDNWLTIDAQEHQLMLSSARVHVDPGLNVVEGTTVNIARLALDKNVLDLQKPATVELDSQKVSVRADMASADRIWFEKARGSWRQSAAPSAGVKGEQRAGTFKEAFRNNMALVYGTAGTPAENRWAFDKARFDAEKFWYQGNGSLDVLADTEFVPSADPNRNVILYGNSKTNRLWKSLLPDSPVNVEEGRIDMGGKSVERADICCIFVRPRRGSDRASVGVISGTGIEGMSLANVVRYVEPGLGLPDLTVFNADMLTKGDAGVMLTGFFGPDWSMGSGEFVGTQR